MLESGHDVFAKYVYVEDGKPKKEAHLYTEAEKEEIRRRPLSQAEAAELDENQKANFSSAVIRGLFEEKLFTSNHVLNLDADRRCAFESDRKVVEQFRRGRQLMAEASGDRALQKYINDGHLQLQDIGTLDAEQSANVNSEPVRVLFDKGRLTYQQVLGLSANQRYAIEKFPEVFAQVYDGTLSLKFVTMPVVQKYINDGVLTEEKFDQLSAEQKLYVNSPVLRELFEARCATFPEIVEASQEQWSALKNENTVRQVKERKLPFKLCGHAEEIRSLVVGGHLSEEQALTLTVNQRFVLETNAEVRGQFQAGKLRLSLIEYPTLQRYIDEDLLTAEKVDQLGVEQKLYLNTPNVAALVQAKLLTVQQAMGLTHEQWRGIKEDDNIVENMRQKTVMLMDGRLMRANSVAAPKSAMHAPAPVGEVASAVAPRGDAAAAQRQVRK